MGHQAGACCRQICCSWHDSTDISRSATSSPACLAGQVLCHPAPWTTTPRSPAPVTSILCHPQLCDDPAPLPPASWAMLPTHRCVGLDESVLQVTGLLPAALTAQVVQLAHWGPQDIGKGADPSRGTWGDRGTLASSSAYCAPPAPPRHHYSLPSCPCPAASPQQCPQGSTPCP